MRVILPSFAKINLTLRIVNKRSDGFHDIVSLFLRIPSGESICIETNARTDSVTSNINIPGENIISKALRIARESGYKIPPLKIHVHKSIAFGSGLGAGSGNAGAVLQWLGAEKVAAKVGADVSFFCSGFRAGIVSGIGDRVDALEIPETHGIVVFPEWKSETGNAYARLDDFSKNYRHGFDNFQARRELQAISAHMNQKGYFGLLPNDFAGMLTTQNSRYNELFKFFAESGFSAWGITGSGSAAFAIGQNAKIPNVHKGFSFKFPDFIRDVLYF